MASNNLYSYLIELGNIFVQGNDTGKCHFEIGGTNFDVVVDIDNRNFSGKDSLDGFLPMPQTQRQFTHGLIVGIEQQRRMTIKHFQILRLMIFPKTFARFLDPLTQDAAIAV